MTIYSADTGRVDISLGANSGVEIVVAFNGVIEKAVHIASMDDSPNTGTLPDVGPGVTQLCWYNSHGNGDPSGNSPEGNAPEAKGGTYKIYANNPAAYHVRILVYHDEFDSGKTVWKPTLLKSHNVMQGHYGIYNFAVDNVDGTTVSVSDLSATGPTAVSGELSPTTEGDGG